MNLKTILMAAAGVSLIAAPARAQVFTTSGAGGGNPNSNSYGFSFTPTVALSLTDVGAFNYHGFTVSDITIQVWHQGDVAALSTTTLSFTASTGVGFDYVFKSKDLHESFTPISLTSGERYAVIIQSATGTFYRNPTAPTTDSSNITLDGLYNPGSVTTQNPFTVGFGSYVTPDATVNIILSSAAVPEPSAYAAVAGLGLVGFAALRKFRR